MRRRIRGKDGARWDAAERAVITGLAVHDLVDVYRKLHGYDHEDYSWFVKRVNMNIGRRFDHVFASAALNAVSCEYLHEARTKKLSDHSPIEVCFG